MRFHTDHHTCDQNLLLSLRWNAAIAFASYLDSHDELINDKFVLELGAGGGLPGIVAAQNDAMKVSDRSHSALNS